MPIQIKAGGKKMVGRKKIDIKRECKITLFMFEEEKDDLTAFARASGFQSVSEFIRVNILDIMHKKSKQAGG
jgi:hypothetical protein